MAGTRPLLRPRLLSPQLLLLLLLLLACLTALSSGSPETSLYFHISEGHQRCFLEDVPPSTLIVGTYHSLDHQMLLATPPDHYKSRSPTPPRILITMLDPQGMALASHMADESGKFSFTSRVGGEHLICLKSDPPTRLGRKFRFTMEVAAGDRAVDYSNMAKQEHLSAIEVEIRKLNDIVNNVRQQQDYQRKKEEEFRDATEGVNVRVVWWSIAQLVVLIVVGVSQTMTLKKFFKSKKNQ